MQTLSISQAFSKTFVSSDRLSADPHELVASYLQIHRFYVIGNGLVNVVYFSNVNHLVHLQNFKDLYQKETFSNLNHITLPKGIIILLRTYILPIRQSPTALTSYVSHSRLDENGSVCGRDSPKLQISAYFLI